MTGRSHGEPGGSSCSANARDPAPLDPSPSSERRSHSPARPAACSGPRAGTARPPAPRSLFLRLGDVLQRLVDLLRRHLAGPGPSAPDRNLHLRQGRRDELWKAVGLISRHRGRGLMPRACAGSRRSLPLGEGLLVWGGRPAAAPGQKRRLSACAVSAHRREGARLTWCRKGPARLCRDLLVAPRAESGGPLPGRC